MMVLRICFLLLIMNFVSESSGAPGERASIFGSSAKNTNYGSARGRDSSSHDITQVDSNQRGTFFPSQDSISNNSINGDSLLDSSIRTVSLASTPESESEDYQAEGVLYPMRSINSERAFQKELRDFVARFPCCSAGDHDETLLGSGSQNDTLLSLENYQKDQPLPSHASPLDVRRLIAPLDFPQLLHDLYKLQKPLATADFKKQATAAIKEANAKKAELQDILRKKEDFLPSLAESETSAGLESDINELKKQVAFLDVFIAYHEKAIAVNNYLDCYNELSFYKSPQPEKRFEHFEAAAKRLKKSLIKSKTANQTLLACTSQTDENKIARALFEKIANQDHEENPFEIALCPGDGNFIPTTHANKWTSERLRKDLQLSLQEGHCPEPPACAIQ